MARIWTEGFEFGDALFFDDRYVENEITLSTTIKRSGNYSLGLGDWVDVYKYFNNVSDEIYIRFALNPELVTNPTTLMTIADSSGWWCLTVGLDNGRLWAWTYNTNHYSSGTVFTPGEWHLIEIHFLCHATTGELEVRVDGVTQVTFSGDTLRNSTDFQYLEFYNDYNAAGTHVMYIDDLAVNDTTGSVQNSWCGDGHIIALVPNGNGDVSQLVGSDGNSTDNYQLVDEVPYSDTDFVEGTAVDQYDLYQVAPYTVSGVSQINQVWVESRSTVSGEAAPNGITLGLKVGGNEYFGPDETLTIGEVSRIVGSGYSLNPDDNQVWESGDITNLQIGVKVR